MKFRLAHLFVLITACACWLAVFQASPNIAILALIGFVPALITIASVTRLRSRFTDGPQTPRVIMVTSLTIAWITIYVLSVGPVVAMAEIYDMQPRTLRLVYRPVIWLHDETIFRGFLDWYGGAWGW